MALQLHTHFGYFPYPWYHLLFLSKKCLKTEDMKPPHEKHLIHWKIQIPQMLIYVNGQPSTFTKTPRQSLQLQCIWKINTGIIQQKHPVDYVSANYYVHQFALQQSSLDFIDMDKLIQKDFLNKMLGFCSMTVDKFEDLNFQSLQFRQQIS